MCGRLLRAQLRLRYLATDAHSFVIIRAKREFGRESEARASPFPESAPDRALLRSLSAGSSFHSVRRMGLRYCAGDPILPSPPPPLLFYAALRDEMTRRREGRLHASCDPEAIRFSRRTNLSKRYNFDVGAFIRCRRFLLGRYLFHILLLCSVCAFVCVRVCLLCCRSMQTTSSSPP